MTVLLEICVDSPAGLAAAIEGGASRIELCSALELGGLTPSPGLMALAGSAPIPVHAMIRPRAGAFNFDRNDERAMAADIDAALTAGLAGLVIGASAADGTLDRALLSRLMARAGKAGVTLHRAFDLVPDMHAALEQAVDLGIERILTSGGRLTAIDGAETIADLQRKAAGRIGIMPGSGLRPDNVDALAHTGVREIHASCRIGAASSDPRAIAFGFEPANSHVTDVATIVRMRSRLDAWG